jgi:hypothetical protein
MARRLGESCVCFLRGMCVSVLPICITSATICCIKLPCLDELYKYPLQINPIFYHGICDIIKHGRKMADHVNVVVRL